MANKDAIEHIVLASNEQPEAEPHKTERIYRQINRSKGCRTTYEIFNGHYLEVRIRRVHGKLQQYTMDLAFLSPQPVRRIIIAWRVLGVAAIAAIVTVLLAIYLDRDIGSLAFNTWFSATILTGTFALVAGLIGLYRCSDRLLFYSEHGGTLFFELLHKGRRNRKFRSFVQDVVQRIQKAKTQFRTDDRSDRLAEELREHRRLKDAAVIDENGYQLARHRILQHHESS